MPRRASASPCGRGCWARPSPSPTAWSGRSWARPFPAPAARYAFLREIYGPERAGNWLSFLYVWQVELHRAAVHRLGLHRASELPGLVLARARRRAHRCAARAALLPTSPPPRPACWSRRCSIATSSAVTRLAWVLFAGVLAAIAGVIVSGFATRRLRRMAHARGARAYSVALAAGGLAQATLLTTYYYWGYYNITFLGGEVRQPERTIPRAILLSRAVRLRVLRRDEHGRAARCSAAASASHAAGSGPRCNWWPSIARSAFGAWAGRIMAALIVWTAFASVFSLLLGYSRVPYAAARDGNYFRFLAAVHPRHHIPHRSLVALGLVAAVFCFFSLAQVITMLVITRILLQFLLQQIGVILLRVQRPDLPRPFRMPLYPLPPLAAMAGFAFLLVYRATRLAGLGVAAAIAVSGTLIYLLRARRLRQWPFLKLSSPRNPVTFTALRCLIGAIELSPREVTHADPQTARHSFVRDHSRSDYFRT